MASSSTSWSTEDDVAPPEFVRLLLGLGESQAGLLMRSLLDEDEDRFRAFHGLLENETACREVVEALQEPGWRPCQKLD